MNKKIKRIREPCNQRLVLQRQLVRQVLHTENMTENRIQSQVKTGTNNPVIDTKILRTRTKSSRLCNTTKGTTLQNSKCTPPPPYTSSKHTNHASNVAKHSSKLHILKNNQCTWRFCSDPPPLASSRSKTTLRYVARNAEIGRSSDQTVNHCATDDIPNGI